LGSTPSTAKTNKKHVWRKIIGNSMMDDFGLLGMVANHPDYQSSELIKGTVEQGEPPKV
jgi:hypothetical protein